MSMQYVREYYGVPVKRGQLVRQIDGIMKDEILVVRSASHHVHASRKDGRNQRVYRFHPLNLEYKTNDGWFRPRQS